MLRLSRFVGNVHALLIIRRPYVRRFLLAPLAVMQALAFLVDELVEIPVRIAIDVVGWLLIATLIALFVL